MSTGIHVVSLRTVLTEDNNFFLILNVELLWDFPSVVSRITLIYSSWFFISFCLTNLLNSLNVSQSSGVPDVLALSFLRFCFLISLLIVLLIHDASHLPLSVL